MLKKKKKIKVICPYCRSLAQLIDSIEIYKTQSYGLAWICKPCDAYVGCHKGAKIPLGRLANAELREYKKRAHVCFDLIWKSGKMGRKKAYAWLADKLGIEERKCHIGRFDIDMCKEVIKVSMKYNLMTENDTY